MEFGFWGFIWNRGRAWGFDYLRRIDIKKIKIGRIDLGEVCLSQWDSIRQRMIGRVAAQLQTAEFGKSVHHLVFFSIAAFPSGQLADIRNWEQKSSNVACLGSAACSVQPTSWGHYYADHSTAVEELFHHCGAPKWSWVTPTFSKKVDSHELQ